MVILLIKYLLNHLLLYYYFLINLFHFLLLFKNYLFIIINLHIQIYFNNLYMVNPFQKSNYFDNI